jgi:hypothetical protein
MDKDIFQALLTKEVESYKALLETKNNDWIVKGFIDVNKNVYTITNDTKVVSKIIEIILIPHLDAFAKKNGMTLELPSAQNYYPDLTFRDGDGNLFAVDFKSSYHGGGHIENRHTMVEALVFNFDITEKIDAEPVRQLELFAVAV